MPVPNRVVGLSLHKNVGGDKSHVIQPLSVKHFHHNLQYREPFLLQTPFNGLLSERLFVAQNGVIGPLWRIFGTSVDVTAVAKMINALVHALAWTRMILRWSSKHMPIAWLKAQQNITNRKRTS